MDDKDLYSGLISLHILHHAVEEGPVYGLWMIDELAHHGYRISAGTLYPMLHRLERKGYLTSTPELREGRMRRVYRATSRGRQALESGKKRVRELFGELFAPPKRRKPAKSAQSKRGDHSVARKGRTTA